MSILLPNCLDSWTLKHHVQFLCNSHTTTMCADPIGSVNMLSLSKPPENNWQLMRVQPKLEKPPALHAPTRNRQLTIPPMLTKRSKPMVVCTCNNSYRRGSGTTQGTVMGAAQMLTQGCNDCTNHQNRNIAPAKTQGLEVGLKTSLLEITAAGVSISTYVNAALLLLPSVDTGKVVCMVASFMCHINLRLCNGVTQEKCYNLQDPQCAP